MAQCITKRNLRTNKDDKLKKIRSKRDNKQTLVPTPTSSPQTTQVHLPNTSGAPAYDGFHHISKYQVPRALIPIPASKGMLCPSGFQNALPRTPLAPNTRPFPKSRCVVLRCSKKAPNDDSTGVNICQQEKSFELGRIYSKTKKLLLFVENGLSNVNDKRSFGPSLAQLSV